MGNITSVFLIVLAISIASALVLGQESTNNLILFLMNPAGNISWEMILATIAIGSAITLVTVPGALLFFKNETILWAGVFLAFAGMVWGPMVDLYNMIAPYNDTIAMLLCSIIGLYVLFSLINWLRAPR